MLIIRFLEVLHCLELLRNYMKVRAETKLFPNTTVSGICVVWSCFNNKAKNET